MNDTISIALVSTECVHAIGDATDTRDMLKRAFKAAKSHWMVLDADPQLKGALNAVLIKMGDAHPDRDRLNTEIRFLGQVSAWLAASQAGLQVDIPQIPEGYEAIGVMELWHGVDKK